MKLHEAMIEVLSRHGGGWMDRDVIADEIAAGSLYIRPSDGLPPPSDQLRLRARSKSYASLFECSDLRCTRIRLASRGALAPASGIAHPEARRAPARQAVGTRTVPATGRVGGRASSLRRLLTLAGRTIEPPQFDPPGLGLLPGPLRAEVVDVYRSLGGVQSEPRLHPGGWDLGCDGIAVELDEDLHFNRYREQTLRAPSYATLPCFPTESYVWMCQQYESECLGKGQGQARWTSPSTERQFGPPAALGDLTGNGAPRWKQRALYDFMKDLTPLAGFGTVVRISVWDVVPVNGVDALVDRLLRGHAEKTAAVALSRLIDARSAFPG